MSDIDFEAQSAVTPIAGDVMLVRRGTVAPFDAVLVSLDALAANDHGHSVATDVLDGFMSAVDKTKLDGIEPFATANSTDLALITRGNHIGTQPAATISDFSTAVAATAAVTANTAKVSNATHTGEVTGSTALTIANNAVTLAKMQKIPAYTFLMNPGGALNEPSAESVSLVKSTLAYTASEVGAQPVAAGLAALSGLSTLGLYYLSAADTWSAVTIGAGLTFTLGTLAASGGGGAPGGSTTQVQFNDAGAFGGDAGFTYDRTTEALSLTGGTFTVGALGINAVASATDRLNLSSDSTLFAHSGAGHQLKVRKASLTDTASIVLQSGAITRGEFGLIGNNSVALQTSPDGSTFNTAFSSNSSGELTIPQPVTMAAQASAPSAPSAGNGKLFARSVGGRILPAMMGPSGLDTSLQPHFGRNSLNYWRPNGNGSVVSSLGLTVTATGTATTASVATTNRHTRMKRIEYLVTTAATTAVAGLRGAANQWTVGAASAGDGGFHAIIRWAPATGVASATNRAFAGMRPSAAPTDVQPSSRVNVIGMGWDAADTNIQFMHNDGSGTATKIDLGASFPVPTVDRTSIYEVALFSPPGTTSSVSYEVTDLVSGAVATGTVTTDLPSNTTLIAPDISMSVGGTSSVVGVAIMGIFVETDY